MSEISTPITQEIWDALREAMTDDQLLSAYEGYAKCLGDGEMAHVSRHGLAWLVELAREGLKSRNKV